MKKCLVVTLLALALSVGVATAEKSETPTLDRLRALINDPRFKAMTYDSGLAQTKVFQDVLESLVPELKALDFDYRRCLATKLRVWLEKNKAADAVHASRNPRADRADPASRSHRRERLA